jgi:hypothetical protein
MFLNLLLWYLHHVAHAPKNGKKNHIVVELHEVFVDYILLKACQAPDVLDESLPLVCFFKNFFWSKILGAGWSTPQENDKKKQCGKL